MPNVSFLIGLEVISIIKTWMKNLFNLLNNLLHFFSCAIDSFYFFWQVCFCRNIQLRVYMYALFISGAWLIARVVGGPSSSKVDEEMLCGSPWMHFCFKGCWERWNKLKWHAISERFSKLSPMTGSGVWFLMKVLLFILFSASLHALWDICRKFKSNGKCKVLHLQPVNKTV